MATIHQVRDAASIREFEGNLLSEVSTETDTVPRWTEMALYKITDGPNEGKYVLNIVGRSVVYHVHDGRCNSGVPTPVNEIGDGLLEDLEPCLRCNPPDPENLPGVPTVDLEEDRHTLHICATADDVVTKLRNPKAATPGRATGPISGPGQRLLAIAASVDSGIKEATTVVERL